MVSVLCSRNLFFFFNDTATTEIYTLSLHDALPIWVNKDLGPLPGQSPISEMRAQRPTRLYPARYHDARPVAPSRACRRSEEHTSELQSRQYLVCRLLLEKKKK